MEMNDVHQDITFKYLTHIYISHHTWIYLLMRDYDVEYLYHGQEEDGCEDS